MNPHECQPASYPSENLFFCRVCGGMVIGGEKMMRSVTKNYQRPVADPWESFKALIGKMSRNRYYNPQAPFVSNRDSLLSLIFELGRHLQLGQTTLISAVAYLDAVLALFVADSLQENLIAFMSVIMAAKMVENPHASSLKEAVSFFENAFTSQQLERCEEIMFQVLGYNLNVITPFDFLEFFLSCGVITPGSIPKGVSAETFLAKFEELSRELVLQAVSTYASNEFSSLAIALSALEIAGRRLRLTQPPLARAECFTLIPPSSLASSIELISELSDSLILTPFCGAEEEIFSELDDLIKKENLSSRSSNVEY